MVSKETRNFAILTLITVIGWVLYELFAITTNTTLSPKYKDLTEPINPEINKELLKSLNKRLRY